MNVFQVTCVIRILAFMEDTAEFFMVILNVIAPQFSKEIDARVRVYKMFICSGLYPPDSA